MLSAGHRMAVIIGMWIAVGIGLWGIGIYGAETGRDAGWLFALAILLPVFTTIILSGALPGFSFRPAAQDKAKRESGSRLALLLELMDEDERIAFKQLLKQQVLSGESDGELPIEVGLLDTIEQDEATSHRSR